MCCERIVRCIAVVFDEFPVVSPINIRLGETIGVPGALTAQTRPITNTTVPLGVSTGHESRVFVISSRDFRSRDPAVNDPNVAVIGLHHVRLPVSDAMRSRDWYTDMFGFEPRLCVEEENGVVGVVLGHRSGLTLGLHNAPAIARALRGFCTVALSIGDVDDLTRWCTRLDELGVYHSAPVEGHLGWYLEVPDPDGLITQLHTTGQHDAAEA